MKRVDYDRIAPEYDARYARGNLGGIGSSLLDLVRRRGTKTALEVGCGTGRWVEELRGAGVSVFGVDASRGMLRQAAARLGAGELAAADANRLPFAAPVFDLVFAVHAIHHFGDARGFIHAAAKLLRPGGSLAVVGLDPRAALRRYFYDWFEGSLELDLERHPSFGQLVDWMAEAGLQTVELRVAERVASSFAGREILNDPFLRKESNSLLALLSDEIYAAGLRRIEAAVAAAEARGEELAVRSELELGLVSGVR